MPRLLAPSISITSRLLPAAISRQLWHIPHGVIVGPFSQLSDFAKMRAVEVLPMPRGPTNRYAWARRFCATAFFSVRETCACPTADVKHKIEFQPRMYMNTEKQNLGDCSLNVGRWTLSVGRLLVMYRRKF